MKKLRLEGLKFNRLTVLQEVISDKGYTEWRCLCDCGIFRIIRGSQLINHKWKSCGCLRKETTRLTRTTHGATSNRRTTKEYRAWLGAKQRCNNLHSADYKYYGERGIKFHEAWKDNFPLFLKELGPSPLNYTLDRIDNNGNYEPGNVRWVTMKIQNENKRAMNGYHL